MPDERWAEIREQFVAEMGFAGERAGFSPANLVPGTGLSPDKMLMARILSYHDTHLHRIGTNYEQLPINAPKSAVHSYNKDGAMTYRNPDNQPVYAPNSFGGPAANAERGSDLFWHVPDGELGRYAYEKHAEDDDFGQPGTMYRQVMSEHRPRPPGGKHRRARERRGRAWDAGARNRVLVECRSRSGRARGRGASGSSCKLAPG